MDFVSLRPILLRSSGLANMNVDGSVVPVEFDLTVPSQSIFRLRGFTLTVYDTQPNRADLFGGGASLANGTRLIARNPQGGEAFDFFDGETWKDNAFLGVLSGRASQIGESRGVTTYWNLADMTSDGDSIILRAGFKIVAIVRDDLTSRLGVFIKAQGSAAPRNLT